MFFPALTTLWAQVGNVNENHAYWCRPEGYLNPRPCYKIDERNPGSDLAGETAVALAASSIAFKSSNPSYSAELLLHAEEIYNFANNHRGKYSDSIPEAALFYNSFSGYMDELALAATWLYKASGDQRYLDEAEAHWNSMQQDPQELSWDNKGRAVAILLAEETQKQQYIDKARAFCNWLKNSAPKIPLVWHLYSNGGSNRHAANVG